MCMRSSQVVRASGCQCQSHNSLGFDPSILRHGNLRAADEAVLNVECRIKRKTKKSHFKRFVSLSALPVCTSPLLLCSLPPRWSLYITGRFPRMCLWVGKPNQAYSCRGWGRTWACLLIVKGINKRFPCITQACRACIDREYQYTDRGKGDSKLQCLVNTPSVPKICVEL